ncbi:type I-E CRISPR-associated protein Cas5/CasD [Aeromonas enteropelogenes]|uniref:type I-E CRISPR-associated protein Cas5/CasD n=1 Tax=Aeromonas enteropelogenes TaxID=29489 RepID=UPI003BA2F2FE
MSTLLLRLQGPIQSWGTTSRFDERDTRTEPSKSGVLGLICAALGRDRCEPVDDLAALKMGVRVDKEGVVLRDYQTATGIINAAGKVDMKRTVVSPRYYLSDAAFLVGFEGDESLLAQIHQALKTPHWSLRLGRKGCFPSPPVYLPDGLRDSDLLAGLRDYPELIKGAGQQVRRLLLEAAEGTILLDQPTAPFANRRFGPRFVLTEQLEPEEVPCP